MQTPEDVRRVVAAIRQWLLALEAPALSYRDYSGAWDGFRAAFGRGRRGEAGIDGDGRADPQLIGSLIDLSSRQLSAEARRRLQEVIDEHAPTSEAVQQIEQGASARKFDRTARRQIGRLSDALVAAIRCLEAVGSEPASHSDERPFPPSDFSNPGPLAAGVVPASLSLPGVSTLPAVGETDPLAEFLSVVSGLAACVEPLKTCFLEPYGKAEAAWRAAREAGHPKLLTLRREIRRWLASHLPAELRSDAERELKAAEDAVVQLIQCPIPMPSLPAGWCEDAEGNRHSYAGGSDQQHRAACARMTATARVALGSAVELDRFRYWAPADRLPVEAGICGAKVMALDDPAIADRSGAPPATRAKRSTGRGEALEKLIAALTKHHQYADGGCLYQEPVGNNALAEAARVSASTASAFFQSQFGGHSKYSALCCDSGKLIAALKLLNGEFAPHLLYGRRPACEGEAAED